MTVRPESSPGAAASLAAPAPIAIIGMACMFPQAPDLRAFWNNILNGVDAVGEPVPSWDAQRYLDAGRIKTQFGGYLRDLYRFDPREFGIMPNSLDGGEPDQFLALRIARDALADAGYLGPAFDHTDTGIVLGHSTYLHRGQVTVIQTDIVIDQTLAVVKATLPDITDQALDEMRALLQARIPPMNTDTAPGLVPNVMTGRIANRLNLRGPNYLVDAACSSSLLAVGAAVDELRAGRSRMMLAGGVNASLPADVATIFTQLGALSARGKVRPFEAGSDGTLLGEGLGVLVLKRLDDALTDGDRVYAVLRGVGQSSDGRGTGLLAPSQDGEVLAIQRTYAAAGVDPDSIGLVEAHGTGIPLGDKTEIASLKAAFGERRTAVGVKALGSVKSMISHCIPAAGVASLIKTSLALHHRVLPPTLCDEVNPELGIDDTPFYINTRTAPWIAPLDGLRRAGVNAFGFGGTNAHAIVEQAPPQALAPGRLNDWPAELCVLSAADVPGLLAKLDRVAACLQRQPQAPLAAVAAAMAREDEAGACRLSLVAKDLDGLKKGLALARKRLQDEPEKAQWTARGGLAYARQRSDGRLAFLFPGEGSQYPEMFADLAMCFDGMQRWLDFWHGLYGLPRGDTRTDIVFPSAEIGAERRRVLEQRMHDMDVGSESVFIGGLAMHELLVSLGVEPDAMLGHSSGESAALGASGANPAVTPQARADCISRHYAVYETLLAAGQIPTGEMLAVGALPPATVEALVAAVPEVVIAMDNCSNQMVLYGPPAGIAQVHKALTAEGGICLPLTFDRGYHTPAFQQVSDAFLQYYKDVKLVAPRLPLYSCANADLFPKGTAAVRKLAAAQWSTKVRFRETVLKMHDDGVRLFVEVGPSAKLTAFVNDILIDRDATALATNVRRRNGVDQLLTVLGQLWVAGRGPVLSRLFGGRQIDTLDLDGNARPLVGVALDNTMPMVRLTDSDRARLGELARSGRSADPAAEAGMAEARTPSPVADRAAEPSVGVAGPGAQAGAERSLTDPRAEVMAGHFALMRDFLAQQDGWLSQRQLGRLGDGAARAQGVDADDRHAVDAGQFAPPAEWEWPSTHARPCTTPLLDEILSQDAMHVHARCRVGLLNDRFIRDHVMSGPVSDSDPTLFGLSCVPFTVSLELMAEACALLAGRTDVRVIENVKAFDWVALDDGELAFEVRAEVLDPTQARYAARVITARGPVLTAEFSFGGAMQLPAVPDLVQPRESALNAPYLYATGMFHGPVFQSMRYVQAWDDSGIDVELSETSVDGFFALGQRPQLVLNPVLLDAMGQVVACWLVQYVGTAFHSFPSTIRRIELPQDCPSGHQGTVLRMRQRPVHDGDSDIRAPRAWNFDCVDGEGRVLMRGQELVNLFFTVPQAYHDLRCDPLNAWLGEPLPGLDESGPLLWQVPMLSEEFCAQSGAICLRIMGHALLAPSEREAWRVFQGNPRRRREWLFGRAALKQAVRAWVHAHTGHLLYPTDIVVQVDDHGALSIAGDWCGSLMPAPAVSLTHDRQTCVAALAAEEQAVGIDIETLGRVRDSAHLAQAWAAPEQALLQGLQGDALDERVLRLWCAKEAAAKCLGTGMQGRPQDFVVAAADEDCGQLLVQHPQGISQVQTWRDGDRILAWASPALAEVPLDA